MKTRRFPLFLACLLTVQFIHAEYFQHIGRSEGLSQSSVMAIYQDQLGRMWFGTREGVNIFNKDKMTVYKGWTAQGSQLGQHLLIGNEVEFITGSANGDVFLTVDNRLLKFDIRKESFRCVGHNVSALTSHHGEIWAACGDSIFCYNEQSGQLEFRLKTGLTDINYIMIDGPVLRIGTKNGLYAIEGKAPVACQIPQVDVYRIFKSSQQELWVACRTQGLYRISAKGKTNRVPYDPASPTAVSSMQIREFVEDRKGNIWFGTFNGLQKYDPRTGTYSLISQEQRPGGLSHSSIFSLYQDVQGTIWIGSYYGGVNYFNPDNNAFSYYAYNPDRDDCLNYPFAGAMTEDKDHNLWVCTDGGGLARLDRETGKFTTLTATNSSLPHNNLKSICYDPKRDQLYIGTHMGGLSRYDRRSGRFHNYLEQFRQKGNGPNDVIFHVAFHNDRLFVSARNGLFVMNPDTNEFRLLLNDRYYIAFCIAPDGDIWLAGTRTVYHLDPKSYTQKEFLNLPANSGQFSIVKILADNRGKLYIATLGSGLFCYDLHAKSLINYTVKENRLLSNYCYNLLQTAENNILITSDRGITLFNPETESFRSIELGNGLSLSSIINGCGVWMCNDRRIFVGGTGGLTSFQEKDLNLKYPKPNLYFSSLSVNNTRISPDDDSGILTAGLPFTNEVELKSTQNNLTLEFASSNYVDILNNAWYEYKLEGFDREWLPTSQTTLKYTNLDPGAYILRVREKGNLLNSRDRQEISLSILISPPWYLTWWAWLSFVIISASIAFFIQRERSSRRTLALSLEREKLEKAHIEEMNQAKLRFFTNVSHEFRTPLTLIISQIELMLQQNTVSPSLYNGISKIKKHARQMKYLITELLDFRKFDQNHIHLKLSEQNVNSFLEEIYLSFSAYAQQKEIDYSFHPCTENASLWIDDWQMRKVLFNLLSNAFKHTPAKGQITLSATSTPEYITITVKDSGDGIRPEELQHIFERFYQADNQHSAASYAGTGIGLALTKGIIELHHGTIEVESTLNRGSCFTVRLPGNRACFDNDEDVSFMEQAAEPSVWENTLPDDTLIDKLNTLSDTPFVTEEKEHYKILLVEDNEELLNLLKEIFSPLYQVVTASNGQEGLQKTVEEKPDLIVSDVMMPVMTGTEMCLKIKSNLNLCHIPVVLLTALDTVEQSIEGLCRGADDYITKPFNAKMLLVRCNNLIRNRLMIQNRFAKNAVAEIDLLAANPVDKSFLERVIKVVDKYIDCEELDIAVLCRELGVGRTLLHTKFKALTGMTPNEFVLNHRLKKAAFMLKNEPHLQVAEISDRLGFGSPRYFSRCFKNQFNMTPVDYRKGKTVG